MKKRKLFVPVFVLVLAIATAGREAHAALGEPAESVAADRAALSAAKGTMAVHDGYTVQEFGSTQNTIREYISPSGVVFGIAWNGMVHADLTKLLGSYTPEYSLAVKAATLSPARRSSRITTDRLVVERWGHMRTLQGRAYAPALIPSGVTADVVK